MDKEEAINQRKKIVAQLLWSTTKLIDIEHWSLFRGRDSEDTRKHLDELLFAVANLAEDCELIRSLDVDLPEYAQMMDEHSHGKYGKYSSREGYEEWLSNFRKRIEDVCRPYGAC